MEEFRDIKGYEGLYQVSNLGRVKSLSRKGSVSERILKVSTDSQGYKRVKLSKEGIVKCYGVHQLLAIAFLGHEPNSYEGLIVDHIDNNPLNNNLENLQLISHRENCSKDKNNKTSKYTGVCWDRYNKKWLSQITIKGKTKKLGRFTCELEASKKYQEELGKLKTNF